MKKAIIVAVIGAFAFNASAGDWGGKAPIEAKNPKAPIGCPDTYGEVNIGYMTDYILHGARLNRDTVWLDVNYTFDSMVPITIGVSHYAGSNGFATPVALDETDVYLSAAIGNFGGFDVALDYTHRFYSNAFNSTGEIGLTLRRDIGFADLILGTDYLLSGIGAGASSGWVHRAGIEKGIGITDSVDLVLSAGVGYHDDAIVGLGNGWSHYYLGAALPIRLSCAATLTPYVGYNGVQQWNQFNTQGDVLHAGVSLSVRF